MKRIKIFRTADGEKRPQMSESVPIGVPFDSIGEFYKRLGEKPSRQFDAFVEYWKENDCERLIVPQALVMTLPSETAREKFGIAPPSKKEFAGTVVLSVWTIGSELEKEAGALTSCPGKMMTGLLLDVSGTAFLYEMHKTLFEWIKNNIAAPAGEVICGENYPGIGSMSSALMQKIVTIGETERYIGVNSIGDSQLSPRKTQCSFISVGRAECAEEIKPKHCEPCSGKRCLYFQLGGCHMTNNGCQPTL